MIFEMEPPSILVLTKNEHRNISNCLRQLSFSDDIVVLDSHSTDETARLAGQVPNVRVVYRAFDTEAAQRNFGLHEIPYKHPWVYVCDADEIVTPELANEIVARINDRDNPNAAYRVRFKSYFLGKWIRHASNYPQWVVRLVQPARANYEMRAGKAYPVIDGPVGELKNPFNRYSFNVGMAKWFEKTNINSSRAAIENLSANKGLAAPWWRSLPLKSFRRFAHCYFWDLGFMDGRPGFHYAALLGMYENWITIKMRERSRPWGDRNEALAQSLLVQPSPAPSPPPVAIDIMIPTLNEAGHIADTVANAKHLGKVFVLDSGSTDGTQQLARDAGAIVVEHQFVDYAQQKNWGLDNLPFTGNWIFILDADERITPALRQEIHGKLSGPYAADAYLINRLLIFMGQAIRHGGYYPSWNLRLFRRGAARYEQRAVHEHMVCTGRTESMQNVMLHIRRENLNQFIAKHIRYADMETDEWMRLLQGSSQEASAGELFPTRLRLRQWLRREVWRRMPGRPFWRFLYMYVVRAGVLDGRGGFALALLISQYEYMMTLLLHEKLAEQQRKLRQKLNPPRLAQLAGAAIEKHGDVTVGSGTSSNEVRDGSAR